MAAVVLNLYIGEFMTEILQHVTAQQARQGRVQQAAFPFRAGTIQSTKGSGRHAVITVKLDGWHAANFRPDQLIAIRQ